jgi:integrase
MALGTYPELSLADARERHAMARKQLVNGIDPMGERKAEKTAVVVATEHTFKKIAEQWLEHWRGNKSARHSETTRNRLKANVYPILGDRPIAEVEPMELVRLAKDIEARGASDMAKRILQIVGMVCRYAVAHGYAKRNPVAEIRPSDILKPTRKQNMARIDAKELPALLRAIEVYEGRQLTRLAIKLMALTFVRTSELIGARWEEFDFDARRWSLPATRMKMKTPHIVPLSSQAIEVLELLQTISGNGALVFPGEQDANKPMSNMTILKALERMGYKGRMTGHGFRGLASTILHEQGYNHDHIELQLAHAPRNEVSAAYNHALYLEPRTRMMQDWADFLEQTRRGGKVLPFRGTAA